MKVLVTGSAGFIGSQLCVSLLKRGDVVIGIDNHNNYYDPKIKEARLLRFKDHLKNISLQKNTHKNNKIKKILSEGKEPIISFIYKDLKNKFWN
jgi:UDP-glucuronate 4-epimerase